MPWKDHASKRKSKKQQYKIINWNAYNKSLINRGDKSFYIPSDAASAFIYDDTWYKERGGQLK